MPDDPGSETDSWRHHRGKNNQPATLDDLGRRDLPPDGNGDDFGGGLAMSAYAIGQLRNVRLNEGVVAYLHGIDATLGPFGGCFIIHGGPKEILEGTPRNDLVVIAFPTIEAARAWYASPAYQALIPLRTQGAEGEIFLIQGVDEAHRATDILR
ncbi:DUF1330 domain-containing protein [Paracoccus benzoatiresistens]|uniref:DUF1330 domain-containing protein n=1 Tax=Paracoccus benzoatiresistens TaxID=2997341 RepID=A0ABT4J6C0_9RHOB|nr:DUF1330 domain-containing protein [Paracoccus sp. EF6]MCZ0962662.1 DUF1330 domain-containing protein [Paracoccus sp. EF6]